MCTCKFVWASVFVQDWVTGCVFVCVCGGGGGGGTFCLLIRRKRVLQTTTLLNSFSYFDSCGLDKKMNVSHTWIQNPKFISSTHWAHSSVLHVKFLMGPLSWYWPTGISLFLIQKPAFMNIISVRPVYTVMLWDCDERSVSLLYTFKKCKWAVYWCGEGKWLVVVLIKA